MYFKVISDLHVDINKSLINKMHFNRDAFYLISGDVSGDRLTTEKFFKKHYIQGVFVEGNHFGYNTVTGDTEDTKQSSIEYLKTKFNKQNKLTFLENDFIEFEDFIIVGCTLYTDFNLFNKKMNSEIMASVYMNDFKYVKYLEEDGSIRLISPIDYEKWFEESVKYIAEVCDKFKDKKIIVVTHHVPTIKIISEEYVADSLTPAYASNLEQFIKDRPNIVLWTCGHTHRPKTAKIGNTIIVCNPFGYFNENNMNLKNLGLDIEVK